MDFITHPKTLESERVMFLGDVFDHLTGEHRGYLEKYQDFFEKVSELISNKKHVYFLEGNHDFHFGRTFTSYLKRKLGPASLEYFHYKKKGFELYSNGTKYFFCHGDDLDTENVSYKRWKKIYTSKTFGLFISHILTYKIVETLGDKASNNSREKSAITFDFEKEKSKYRKAAKIFLENNSYDCLIAGHTHIEDSIEWNGKSYHNIGFPPKSKSFLFIGKDGVERVAL